MITTFSELHCYIKKTLALSSRINNLKIFLQQSPIVVFLHLRHTDLENCFLLWRQTFLNIRLQSPKKEWTKDLIQSRNQNISVFILNGVSKFQNMRIMSTGSSRTCSWSYLCHFNLNIVSYGIAQVLMIQTTRQFYLMKLLDHLLLVILTGYLKPLIKCLSRAKDLWQQKVQKRPELMKIILCNSHRTQHIN